MSSIRKFRDLASRLFRLTQVARKDNPLETVKEFDAMLDSIAEMLELTERTKADSHMLSTVADNNMADLAFGYPMFRDFFGATTASSATPTSSSCAAVSLSGLSADTEEDNRGPCLIIHQSPKINVTKIDEGEGTPLESLFRRITDDSDEYVDHESICSQGTEGDPEEEEMIPMEHEGISYLRSSTTHRMFTRNSDGSQGPCAGVWMFQQFVPLDAPPPLIPTVLVEKVET
jgi:hypothetical protein